MLSTEYSQSSAPLIEHSIHDESQSSVENDPQVHRQLTITRKAFGEKRTLLEKLLRDFRPDSSPVFKSLIRVSKEEDEQKLELMAFTKDGSSLGLCLSRYGNTFFFGTRGSPTKVLSGQNLVEIKEVKAVDQLAKKLGVTKFEARSLIGFLMLKVLVRDVLGPEAKLFNEQEAKRLRKAEIGVYSVGYARYVDFGANRDQILSFLGYCGLASITLDRVTIKLVEMLGVSSNTWEINPEEDLKFRSSLRGTKTKWFGRLTGILFQKKTNNVISCQQMLYLKADEVEAKKKTSGKKNSETMRGLDNTDLDKLGNTLVRVDNVFYRESMAHWVKWATGKTLNSRSLLAKDVAVLFEGSVNLNTMIAATTTELGLRTLLMAPTLERIDALIDRPNEFFTVVERKKLSAWRATEPTMEANPSTKSKRMSFDNPISSQIPGDPQLISKMFDKEFLDLHLPYDFFVHLNKIRSEFFLNVHEQRAMSMNFMGYTGTSNLSQEIPAIQKRVRGQVVDSIKVLRENLATIPYNKNSPTLRRLGEQARHLAEKDFPT